MSGTAQGKGSDHIKGGKQLMQVLAVEVRGVSLSALHCQLTSSGDLKRLPSQWYINAVSLCESTCLSQSHATDFPRSLQP